MPYDLVQIGLEHHRAGRLQQAQAAYREALDQDPGSIDAAHWLGVLILQAGRPDQALPLLERAAARRPDDAAFEHNLAQAYLGCGRATEAIASFGRALALEPARTQTLIGLGLAHLARRPVPDAKAATAAFVQARDAGIDTGELHHYLGVALLAEDRPDESIAASLKAVEKRCDLAPAHYYLGLAYRRKGNPGEAQKCFHTALQIDPGYVQAIEGLAVLEGEAGRLDAAADLFGQVIALRPQYAPAYQALGQVLRQAGKPIEAMRAFEQAALAGRGEIPLAQARTGPPKDAIVELQRRLTPSPAAAGAHFALAAQAAVFPPGQVPPSAVTELYGRYAENFDDHLREKLEYRVPEMIAEAIAAIRGSKPLDVLDLGCGTGLCGLLLRAMAATLAGVDLSAPMIAKAKARGVYDTLEVGDLVATMERSPGAFDLLVAADVLIYLGDLAPTFEAAATSLRPGGLFVYSVEAGGGDRYHLQKNNRFAHSKSYLQRLAGIYGFSEEKFSAIIVRQEAARPVAGYLAILRAPLEKPRQDLP